MRLTTLGMIIIPMLVVTLIHQRGVYADEDAFEMAENAKSLKADSEYFAFKRDIAEIDRHNAAQQEEVAIGTSP